MTKLRTLALTKLPLVGQMVLAKCTDPVVREILATSSHTDISIVDMLAHDWEIAVRGAAFNRCTDSRLLRETWNDLKRQREYDYNPLITAHPVRIGIAKNPQTDPEALTHMLLTGGNRTQQLYASVNPATPEKDRRQYLTGYNAGASLNSATAIHEIVLANPWMAETPTTWDEYVQLAICNSPATTQAVLHAVAGTTGDCATAARKHPAWDNINMTTLNADDLLKTGSIAAQLHALQRPEFTAEHGKQLVANSMKERNQDRLEPDAHVIGRLVNRFGIGVLHTTGKYSPVVWRQHLDTATWIAPILKHLGERPDIFWEQDALDANRLLADDPSNWSAYVALLSEWYGGYTQAALTTMLLNETDDTTSILNRNRAKKEYADEVKTNTI